MCWGGKTKKPVKKINIITGETINVYDSISRAAEDNDTTTAQIVKVLDHAKHIHKGYSWRSA